MMDPPATAGDQVIIRERKLDIDFESETIRLQSPLTVVFGEATGQVSTTEKSIENSLPIPSQTVRGGEKPSKKAST